MNSPTKGSKGRKRQNRGKLENKNVKYINTKLQGFLLLDAITETEEEKIVGARRFFDEAPWMCAESLAQLGAFHVRFLTGFKKHAFLLKINRCLMPYQGELRGRYLLRGTLLSRSSAAFSYELNAGRGNQQEITGIFLYVAVDYDDVFKKELLQEHYLRLFSCLRNVTEEEF